MDLVLFPAQAISAVFGIVPCVKKKVTALGLAKKTMSNDSFTSNETAANFKNECAVRSMEFSAQKAANSGTSSHDFDMKSDVIFNLRLQMSIPPL